MHARTTASNTRRKSLAEPAVAIGRERRVVRDLVVKIEAAEPAIGEMQFDLLAKPPLKANAVAVANDEHADHQLGVDRWPPDLAVERRKLLPELSQYPTHNRIDAAKEVAFRDALLKVEEIEQLALIDRLPTHHDPSPPLKASTKRNRDSPIISSDFFNTIDPKAKHSSSTLAPGLGEAALRQAKQLRPNMVSHVD